MTYYIYSNLVYGGTFETRRPERIITTSATEYDVATCGGNDPELVAELSTLYSTLNEPAKNDIMKLRYLDIKVKDHT